MALVLGLAAATAVAVHLTHVVWGAVSSELRRSDTRRRLRRRRRAQAEAMAEVIAAVEDLTAQGPDDLQAALGCFGPNWIIEHQPYALAARALATEFRALRCCSPDPKRDVQCVQAELRGMLTARKCRNKDAIRIIPMALIMCFYKSDYEQIVEHAFATPMMRDRLTVAQDDPLKPTWLERLTGSYQRPVELGR